MNLIGKRVLVSGGAGFIGSHLVDALLKEHCQVRIIDNLVNGKLQNLKEHKKNKKLEIIIGDITNYSILNKAMKGIDIVFHLACLGVRHSIKYPLENQRVNAQGTLLVLQSAHRFKVKRFIYCSSSEIYGTAKYIPMPETHPAQPSTIYGASKLAGEIYTRVYQETYGLKTVILRPFNTYGPRSHYEGDAGELIPKSIVRAIHKKPLLIFGDGSQKRDFTYVEDTAKSFIEAVKCDKTIGLTMNVGSGFEISIKQIAKEILKICGVRKHNIRFLKNRPGDVLRLYADASLFRKITLWQPKVSFEEGLSNTIQWFKKKSILHPAMCKEETGINWK